MPSLSVNGTEIHYAEAGAGGRPLLLVHGTLGDQRSFAAQMEPLAAAGLHVMALSLRHCWPGTWPAEGGDFRIDTHVADVAAFVLALGKGPVALLGHSRGGHIAVRVAERHPAWPVNHKRTYRLYAEEGLSIRTKLPRRKRAWRYRQGRPGATAPNEIWAMDFMSDGLFDGARSVS